MKIPLLVLIGTFIGFLICEVLEFEHIADVDLSLVALAGALVLYLISRNRKEILRRVDYTTLIFFVAMFIVTSALWYSGAIQMLLAFFPQPDPANPLQSNAIISVTSIVLSQLLSNVPFVALYNYVMIDNGFTPSSVDGWMMLSAASSIAGNLTILAAASNIIIIQAADARGTRTFTFMQFFKVGAMITLLNIVVFYLYITFL